MQQASDNTLEENKAFFKKFIDDRRQHEFLETENSNLVKLKIQSFDWDDDRFGLQLQNLAFDGLEWEKNVAPETDIITVDLSTPRNQKILKHIKNYLPNSDTPVSKKDALKAFNTALYFEDFKRDLQTFSIFDAHQAKAFIQTLQSITDEIALEWGITNTQNPQLDATNVRGGVGSEIFNAKEK